MSSHRTLLLASVVACAAGPASARPDEAAVAFVEEFCAADLIGNETRFDRAIWTQPSDDPERGVFLATWNEFAIVTACRVAAVDARGDAGKATIRCTRIGRSDGKGAISPEPASVDDVALALRREKGAWRVVDPAPPRVHVEAAIEAFEADLAQFSPGWESRANDIQRREHERVAAGLAALREMRGKLGERLSPKTRTTCR